MSRFEKLHVMAINNESPSEKFHQLSIEEIKAVKNGMDQIENGFWISNEEANKKIEVVLQKLM